MDLSPAKREILHALTAYDKPVKALQVAKDISKAVPPVQMHLIGLVKMGYAASPEKGAYVILPEGRKALGQSQTQVTKEQAKTILSETPHEQAFQFYTAIGKPTFVYANSLVNFCNKINQVPIESVEFHLYRGDFEAWFKSLGDEEIAKKTVLLREKKLAGEELRTQLIQFVSERYTELSKLII